MLTSTSSVGSVNVTTTVGRGHSPDEVANMAVKHIISIGPNAPEPIRQQAEAYAQRVEKVIAMYMRKAIQSDRTTIFNALKDAGHPELAQLITRL